MIISRFRKVLPLFGALLIATNASGCSNLPFAGMANIKIDGGVAIERLEDGSIMLHVDSCGNPVENVSWTPYAQKPTVFELDREDPISEPFSVQVGNTELGWNVSINRAPDGSELGWIADAFGPNSFETPQTSLSIETFNKLQPGQYFIGVEDDGSGIGGNGHIVTKETFHNAVCEKEE